MTETKANSLSVSLLNRKIYAVCYTGQDPIGAFHSALYSARQRFFETGKAVHVRENGIYDGVPGEVRGKISRRGFRWVKKAGKHVLETAFANGAQRGIAFYDPNGVLRAHIFFDREQHWVRTEYFAPDDSQRAKICFKPDDTRDAVIRFDYSRSTGKTKETLLFPVPYAYQTAEQSLQNARCGGDTFLLVSTDTGEFAYCPREEQQRRIRFMKDSRNASVMLSMGWEIKDGDITAPDALESAESEYRFAGLEDMVQIAPAPETTVEPEATAEPETTVESETTAEPETTVEPETKAEPEAAAEPETTVEPKTKAEPETAAKPETAVEPETAAESESEAASAALAVLGLSAQEASRMRDALDRLLEQDAQQSEATSAACTLIRDGAAVHFTGSLEKGLRTGFGRTETPEGVTLYEGEYKDDKREGFGAQHYRSGAISYVGDFKNDRREGFGVSFREKDHALHVSRWSDGKPERYAALFAPDGTLRFAGKILDGQKQGAGVSIDTTNDTVFVAKYRDNTPTGEGALFAGDGTLLYTGGWKDGKRNGHGVEFDGHGDIVYAGEWKDDAYLNGILYKKVQGPDDGQN